MTRRERPVYEGVVTGLIGYATIAVFFAAVDVLAGRAPIFTLDLMGKVLFRGARDAAGLRSLADTDLSAMATYTVLHLAVSLGVGLAAAQLVARAERRPELARPLFGGLLVGWIVVVVVATVLARDLSELLPGWAIIAANMLAALAGGLYLWRAHPDLSAAATGQGS